VTAADNIKVESLRTSDHSSGGVPVNSSGGTIYGGGSSSIASRSIAAQSISGFSDAPRTRSDTDTDTSSMMSSNATDKPSFNPHRYGDPGLRSQPGSVVSSDSPSKSKFARVRPVASKLNSDAARSLNQELENKRRIANKYEDEDEVEAAEEVDSEGDEPAPSPKAPARRAPAKGTVSKSNIQAAAADDNQGGRGDKLTPKDQKRQTTTDISRAVYSQEEAYHEIVDYSDGSLSNDSEDYGGVSIDEGFHG